MLRVVAIEDDARYRSSLEMLLQHSGDFVLVRAFDAADRALAELQEMLARGEVPPWDLILMDLDLPRLGGVECTRRIKELLPAATIVVLTVFEDRAAVLDAICAGADGYLVKNISGDQLIEQLRSVVAGGSPLSAGIARTVLDLVRHRSGPGARPGRSSRPLRSGLDVLLPRPGLSTNGSPATRDQHPHGATTFTHLREASREERGRRGEPRRAQELV